MKRLFFILAVLACALIAKPAIAKQGFYLGGFIPITSIDGTSLDAFDEAYFKSLDPGIGLGLRAGYGFNNYLAIQGTLFTSFHAIDVPTVENQDLAGQTIDLKVNIPFPESIIELYFLAGIGAYQIGDSGGTYYKGGGYQIGAGLDIYLVPELSINTGLTFRNITFDGGDFHFIYDTDADAVTFDFGFDYHF